MGNLSCKDSNYPDQIDALCYRKCPEGMEHTPGMPYLCRKTGVPFSETRGVGSPMICPEGKDQDGLLCYESPQKGWRRLAATYWQDCPAGTTDFGVGCTKEGYNRGVGKIPNLIATFVQEFLG